MAPGLLAVNSSTLEDGKLSDDAFSDWFEKKQIPDVTALSGIPGAVHYEAVDGVAALGDQLPFLTLYEMTNLAIKDSAEFKALDGQSKPPAEILERIFKHARFDSRFLELLVEREAKGLGQGSSKWLCVGMLGPLPDADEADCDKWLKTKRVEDLAKMTGFSRIRFFKVKSASKLEAFEREELELPLYVGLHEFNSDKIPFKELFESNAEEMDTRFDTAGEGIEVSFWKKKRGYGNKKADV